MKKVGKRDDGGCLLRPRLRPYKGYYEVQESVEENPLYCTAKAQKKLKPFVEASRMRDPLLLRHPYRTARGQRAIQRRPFQARKPSTTSSTPRMDSTAYPPLRRQRPLDEIVRAFNEHHFADREAPPKEQRVKFINAAKHVMSHADYKAQVENNPDSQNRQLALERQIQQAVGVERRRKLDLY